MGYSMSVIHFRFWEEENPKIHHESLDELQLRFHRFREVQLVSLSDEASHKLVSRIHIAD